MPVKTVVVKEEVVKEVMVPVETVVVEKVVTETVEVPGETVTVEVVKDRRWCPVRPWWWRKRSSRPSRSRDQNVVVVKEVRQGYRRRIPRRDRGGNKRGRVTRTGRRERGTGGTCDLRLQRQGVLFLRSTVLVSLTHSSMPLRTQTPGGGARREIPLVSFLERLGIRETGD